MFFLAKLDMDMVVVQLIVDSGNGTSIVVTIIFRIGVGLIMVNMLLHVRCC